MPDGPMEFCTSNNQPRPEDVVLGRPPRGGRFRVVAPLGGVEVGKAPLEPLVVTRGPTPLDDSPVPPGRGYTAAHGPHPNPLCSRSSPAPRNQATHPTLMQQIPMDPHVLFPFRKPTTNATLYFGGILRHK